MELILVRHGETYANRTGALDTAEPGLRLTERGVAQAESLVPRWAELGMPTPDLIMTSSLLRTQQTARPLLQHFACPTFSLPWGREIGAGSMEMATDTDSIVEFLWVINQWMQGNLDVAMPDGETGQQVLERFDRLVDFCAEEVGPTGVAVIVAHGAIIRFWSNARVPEVTRRMAAAGAVPNTATAWFTGMPGRAAKPATLAADGQVLVPADPGTPGTWEVHHWADKPISECQIPAEMVGKEITRELLRALVSGDYFQPTIKTDENAC